MLERSLEQVFVGEVRKAGGVALKIMPVNAGAPDRIVLWPGGMVSLVELKTETGAVSKVQREWHRRSGALGHPVAVVVGSDGVRRWIRETLRSGVGLI